MFTRKIFTLTLLATALALNAAIPREVVRTTKQRSNSISTIIAQTLQRRGIEDDKAIEISSNFVQMDEELFAFMVNNYLSKTGISQDKLYTELSKLALQKKKADFSSYAFLTRLTLSIDAKQPDKQKLAVLSTIASNNQRLKEVFA